MKISRRTLLIATLLSTLISPQSDAVFPLAFALNDNESQHSTSNDKFDYYVGSNARWLVDRERGVVSAWSLKEEIPLWSRDGVVYRATPIANVATQEIKNQDHLFSSPATEIFGRVYFLLDDVAHSSRSESLRPSLTRRDDLLIALDRQAQGRLVWERRAQDFIPFFPKNARLRFLNDIKATANDELLVYIQAENTIKGFALNAATGEPRPLKSLPTSD